MKKYVAFFDLDHTVLSENSGRILIAEARKDGLIERRVVVEGIFLSALYHIGLLSPQRIMNKMASWLEGIPEERFIRFVNHIFEKKLKPIIRYKAREAVQFHQNSQGHTVILSAATNYICNPVRDSLDMADVICSRMEVIDGYFSGKAMGAYCYGDEKLKRIRDYCQEHLFRLEEAYYYADSISDLQVLESVGHPICISPDKKLREIAQKKGWQIITW